MCLMDSNCRAIEQPYKWMLYGDDDTLFFPDTTAKLLQNLDPDMPYFLTGAYCFPQAISKHNPYKYTHNINTTRLWAP